MTCAIHILDCHETYENESMKIDYTADFNILFFHYSVFVWRSLFVWNKKNCDNIEIMILIICK